MTAVARPNEVRRLSTRVALTATALVAATYLAVAVAAVWIVTNNLTHQVDERLTSSLTFASHPGAPHGPGGMPQGPGDRPYAAPLLFWQVQPDGSVSTQVNATLPPDVLDVTTPTTVTINGFPVRVAGADIGDDHVVVGQEISDIGRTQSTLILAEAVIGPVLLAIVFLGAVAIGRRVATPIEQARRRQLEFTADASHELRTPLSVIEANASLALAQDRSESWYRTAFQRVDHESKRMHRLVDDLLWLARFDTTDARPDTEPVDLAVLAAQTVDRFGAIAETRHLNLAVAGPSESTVISAPPEWLDRLLGVLLDNACKYSPDGGTVAVTVAGDGGRIQLTVDDAGPGIPVDERTRIFDRFHRATDSQSGAGLGLAIADAIVRATNGRWKIGASPAGGASMSVSWARAFSGPREAAAPKAAAPKAAAPKAAAPKATPNSPKAAPTEATGEPTTEPSGRA